MLEGRSARLPWTFIEHSMGNSAICDKGVAGIALV